jgi:hypothetical protein
MPAVLGDVIDCFRRSLQDFPRMCSNRLWLSSSLNVWSLVVVVVVVVCTTRFNNTSPYIPHKLCFAPPLQQTATTSLGNICTLFFVMEATLFSARYEMSRLQMIK